MTAASILTAHLPITRRNVDAVAAQIEKYLQANAPRIMAQKPSEARRKASRLNGRNGGRPRIWCGCYGVENNGFCISCGLPKKHR